MPATPSTQRIKVFLADHRLTFFMILGVLLMLASSVLIFLIGDNNYEQALCVLPLTAAVLLLILSSGMET